MPQPPLVVRFDTMPLDLTEPEKLFERSRFNYFHRDDVSKALMGFWDVQNGEEWTDKEFGLDPVNEVIIVLEGQIYAQIEGEPEQVAGPGDALMILSDRPTHVMVRERARAFFIVYGADPEPIERMIRGS